MGPEAMNTLAQVQLCLASGMQSSKSSFQRFFVFSAMAITADIVTMKALEF